MKIYLGADHRGFACKEHLREWLKRRGNPVVDLGNKQYEPEDDFPDYALRVAEAVSRKQAAGILVCGSGGMALAANKVKGIRAVEADTREKGEHAKSHDHANILAIPADAVTREEAEAIVKAWLEAEENRGEKYQRRIKKILAIEDKYCK